MSTNTKNSSMKGKRYSDDQKQEVVSFVEKHNAEKGRGGQSAASSKYGVSQLTIAGWLKSAGSSSASKKSGAPRAAKAGKAAKAAKAGKAVKAPRAAKGAKAAKATKGARKYAKGGAGPGASSGNFSSKLSSLMDLGNQIQQKERELEQLKGKFNSLKGSL